MTEPLRGYLSLQLHLIMVVCLECKMVIKKVFFLFQVEMTWMNK